MVIKTRVSSYYDRTINETSEDLLREHKRLEVCEGPTDSPSVHRETENTLDR